MGDVKVSKRGKKKDGAAESVEAAPKVDMKPRPTDDAIGPATRSDAMTNGHVVVTSPKNTTNGHAVATSSTTVDDHERRRLIAEAAYFRAVRRNFANGSPETDWLEAEAELLALQR